MVNHEVTRTDRQEHIGVAVDGIEPATHVGGIGIGSGADTGTDTAAAADTGAGFSSIESSEERCADSVE